MLAAVVGFMIIGGIYLYVKKPNLFKTYVQGVQARLFLRSIPLAFKNYRKRSISAKATLVSEEIRSLGIRIFAIESRAINPEKNAGVKELQGKMGKKISEQIALKQKLTTLDKSIAAMEEKVKILQDRANEAGWKDFQRQLLGDKAAATPSKTEKSPVQRVSPEDGLKVLMEHLLSDPTLMEDPELKKLLEHAGIDIEEIRRLSPQSKELIIEESLKVVRAPFAGEEGATMKRIKNKAIAHG